MKFDYTRKNDIDYVLKYAIELNPEVIRGRLAGVYGANPGLITSVDEMVTFLKKRVNDGLEITKAFDGVVVSPQSIHANDFIDQVRPFGTSATSKEFGETYVGQLLLGLFGGGGNANPPVYQPPTPAQSEGNTLTWIIGGVLIVVTMIAIAVIVSKAGKG